MRQILALALLSAMNVPAVDDSLDDRAIKVTSPARVKSARAALVKFIWGTSWSTVTAKQPNAVDRNYAPTADDALPAHIENLQSIDRLDAGASENVASTVFILYPAKTNVHKAVIVHHGHACGLVDSGNRPEHLELAIRKLLSAGYTVAAMRMPLYQSLSHCGASRAHDKFFDLRLRTGSPVKFFLEPIARTVNYLVKHQLDLEEIDMIGLSGGGWTTTLYAAVDPRVVKSFPVAGTLPLYLRGGHYNHDLEQYFKPLYTVAGYKDLYVLGASGIGRMQVQILNRYDDCCFGERQHTVGPPPFTEAIREYERDVRNTLQRMQTGSFTLYLDESATYHQIPSEAIEKVILPVLAGAPPPGPVAQTVLPSARALYVPVYRSRSRNTIGSRPGQISR
jgi:pimeloyl-ACP methyl ester carboxylesterase